MNKNKQLILKENVSPKTKKRIFRELLSLYIEKSIDSDLDYETILWRIRECSNGLMFQFSDGTINTSGKKTKNVALFLKINQTSKNN